MIYSVPFSIPFLKAVSAYLLRKNLPFPLSEWTIYLPTVRACQFLETTLLEQTEKKTLILPRIIPFGEINPEEISLISSEGADQIARLPSLISPHRRRLLLASLIEKFQYTEEPISFDQALIWSENLMHLIDEMRTASIDLKALGTIVPDSGQAHHWEKIKKFLGLISDHWDDILREEECIEPIAWQREIMKIQADLLEQTKPEYPLMIAGSLGTIPSTVRLIKAVSRLKNGVVVLPGLQKEERPLSCRHPQFFLHRLLKNIEIPIESVEEIRPSTEENNRFKLENIFDLKLLHQEKPLFFQDDLEYLEASDQGEEARVIAVAIRKALEEGKKRIACISADQSLLSRVSQELEFWSLAVPASKNKPLLEGSMGSFLHLAFLCLFSPSLVTIASLFKHPLVKEKKETWNFFEKHILRSSTLNSSWAAIEYSLEKKQKDWDPETYDLLITFYKELKEHCGVEIPPCHLGEYLTKIESLVSWILGFHKEIEGVFLDLDPVEGLEFQQLWADLRKSASLFISDPEKLSEIVFTLLKRHQIPNNVQKNTERVFLMTPSEARFFEADFKILAGLNEGVWPAEAISDPFFSSSMRNALDLPSVEARIGQHAHDFLSFICMPGPTLITRSLRLAGVPSSPSRFLSYLELKLGFHQLKLPRNIYLKAWAKNIECASKKKILKAPRPCPPLSQRPTIFSITDISLLMRDPYAIYAKYILNLRKLQSFESKDKHRLFGIFVHDFLHRWRPTDDMILDDFFWQRSKSFFELYLGSFQSNRFWWEQFVTLLEWVQQQKTLTGFLTEVKGSYSLCIDRNLFTLVGRVDRIEWDTEGIKLIDYKTGRLPSLNDVRNGKESQLLLEALIFFNRGFVGVPRLPLKSLEYWGVLDKQIISLKEDMSLFVGRTQQNLEMLLALFYKETTPYLSHPKGWKKKGVYDHLSRIQEWHKVK